mmetsp:Transcript_6895/g.15096  ORF Transcript_6895/g.15096 Transcript_6895/m.15096 type:complete len:295 (-) Transcript_6895:23-907(-)
MRGGQDGVQSGQSPSRGCGAFSSRPKPQRSLVVEKVELEKEEQQYVEEAHAAEQDVHLALGLALAVGEAVAEVRVEVGEQKDARDAAAHEHQQPPQDVRGQHAEHGDGDENAECVAVNAENVHETLASLVVSKQQPEQQRQHRHVRVDDRAGERQLVEVVRPLWVGLGGFEGEKGGEVAGDGHAEDKRRRDPKRAIQVGRRGDEVEENAARPREQRGFQPCEYLKRVDIEERLVVLERPEASRCGGPALAVVGHHARHLLRLQHRVADAAIAMAAVHTRGALAEICKTASQTQR